MDGSPAADVGGKDKLTVEEDAMARKIYDNPLIFGAAPINKP
jgi:hypothetical protein